MRIEKEKIRKFCTAQNVFWVAYLVLTAVFLLIPSLGVKTKKNLNVDNRAAAPFPEISARNYQNFAPQFERYLADRFQMRKSYIHAWNFVLYHLFRESPHEQIVLGEDGCIFLAGHFAGKEHENSLFRDLLTLNPDVIQKTAQGLLAYQPYFRQGRLPLLFVTVPTKHSLNFAQLPANLRRQFSDNPAGVPVATKITEALQKADPAYAEQYFLDLYPDAVAANREMQLIPAKNFHWIPGPYTHLAAHQIARKFNVTQEEFVLRKENYLWCNTESDLDYFFGFALDNPAWTLSPASNPAERIPFTDKYPLANCPEPVAESLYFAENPALATGKVLVIGDSFTPAIGQDLARYFAQAATMDFMKMQRCSPELARQYCREVLRIYQPDYVVILSYAGYVLPDVAAEVVQRGNP